MKPARHAIRTLIGVIALVAPLGLQAQSSCLGVPSSQGVWAAPLDRVVTLDASTLPVREALERAAKAAGVRLTYASELIPDRLVCGSVRRVALGDAISLWLSDAAVRPLVVSEERVVLVPARVSPSSQEPVSDLALSSAQLAPVIVRDSAVVSLGPISVAARTVITADQLAASGATNLAQALSGGVPGLWMWTPTPSSLGTGMGSLRGASSFGASYPKVYIDGIEVANPLFLGQVPTDQVAQIEVIRGPQGSALYGAGAINGVISITTHQGAGTGDASGMSMRSLAGISESAFSPLGAFVQEHTFNGEFGNSERRLGVGASTATTGAFIPGAFSRQLQAIAGYSAIGSRHRLQLTGRMFAQRAGNPESPLLPELATPVFSEFAATGSAARTAPPLTMFDTSAAQSVRQYTLGGTLALDRAKWVHTFVAGVDGYRLNNVSPLPASLRTPADSALLAASGAADRLNGRWNANTRRGDPARVAAAFTFGADHSSLRDASLGATPAGEGPETSGGALWRRTTGLTGHAEVSVHRSLVITGGLRAEHNSGYTVLSGENLLPTIGAAYRRTLGSTSLLTVRGAWGRAIQPPRVGSYALRSGGRIPSVLALEPEEQAGIEFGADLHVGSRLALSVTRYDQQARNLIQPVTFATGFRGRGGVVTRPENIGAIANRGWEVESRYAIGALTLTGALGITDSRVRQVANGYTGELRAGDRMLQVPARTISAGASWLGRGWSSSMTLARASDWMNYDWLALSLQPQVSGAGLRDFWMQYPGVTRVRASFSRDITRSLGLTMSGDNLLGWQRGEPDNLTIVPGRTFRAGLRARFP